MKVIKTGELPRISESEIKKQEVQNPESNNSEQSENEIIQNSPVSENSGKVDSSKGKFDYLKPKETNRSYKKYYYILGVAAVMIATFIIIYFLFIKIKREIHLIKHNFRQPK